MWNMNHYVVIAISNIKMNKSESEYMRKCDVGGQAIIEGVMSEGI